MTAYTVSPRARRDLLEIWKYIANDDEAAANRIITEISDCFEVLANNPHAGRSRDELRQGYRGFVVREYVILYFVSRAGVRIARVVHGRRDLPKLFVH